MNRSTLHLALAGLLLLSTGAAWAGAEIKFIEPDKFTDLPFVPWQKQQTLDDIAGHFKNLAKALPPGQDLTIEVLDVDLAGREQPNRFSPDPIRILHGGADWPRMHLRYSLAQNGQVVKSGEARLSDKSYADHINMYPSYERLRYEKQMIDEWWEKTIGPARPARN